MNQEVRIHITGPDELDMQQYCQLQQAAFEKLLHKNKVSNDFIMPAFFQWKYNTPAGKARIAFATENGQILASVAMYPVNLISKGRIFKSWHFTEAAVLPQSRQRGLFHACMQALIDTLLPEEMIYVFPNHSSMKGTIRLGFQPLADLPFYIKLLFKHRTAKFNLLQPFDNYNEAQDIYAGSITANSNVMLYKDAAYMNWRYKQHPYANYYTFSVVAGEKVTGNVVVRSVFVKGVKLLLIMELHAVNKSAKRELFAFIQEVANAEKCSLAGIFTVGSNVVDQLIQGFFKVPSMLMPKKQRMMGYLKKMSDDGQNYNWFCQTGDWDAF